MTKTHFTAVVSFTVDPEYLHEIIHHVNECIQNYADHGTEFTLIAQESEPENTPVKD
jgi:hypothetical protein